MTPDARPAATVSPRSTAACRRRSAPVPTVLLAASLALALGACDTSLEAPIGDLGDGDTGTTLPDVTDGPDTDGTGTIGDTDGPTGGDTDTDTGEGPSDSPPVTDDTSDDGPTTDGETTVIEGLNACGGFGALRYRGVSAAPSDPCGDLGEGVLVCEGTLALRCVDEAPFNECGSRGLLSVGIGNPCGCGGTWVCGPDGLPRCAGFTGPNNCGGCSDLANRPWSTCGGTGGNDNDQAPRWICDGSEQVRCEQNPLNACGTQGNLTWLGAPALPGGPCLTSCGPGVLLCSTGPEQLECVPVGDTVPENECGGCLPLPAEAGTPCGCFNSGTWRCEDGGLRCVDSVPRDVCGNCTGSAVELGRRCDVVPNGIWLCEGPALSCLEPVDPLQSNACGGTSELSADPGEPCGDCLSGRWACTTRDSVSCEPDPDHERNECGGCAPLPGEVGMACGECGSGELVCADGGEGLRCSGNNPNLLNACGGCGDLPGNEGDACGPCRVLACVGGNLNCVLEEGCAP